MAEEKWIEIKLDKRLVERNREKLKELVKKHPGYKFRFFMFGTDGLIVNAKTKEDLTPDEMLNLNDDFQIKDVYVSEHDKIVDIDVALFGK